MPKKSNSKYYKVLPNVSIYKRDGSKSFYGYLRINGKQIRRSLDTTNKQEAEKLVIQLKQDLILDPESPVAELSSSFVHFARKLLKREEKKQMTNAGLFPHKETARILNRKRGLIDFFGDRDIRSIRKTDIEEFLLQLAPPRTKLAKSTLKHHLNALRKVLNLADVSVEFPKINGIAKKSERRGYFNKEEYKFIRDKSLEMTNHSWKTQNGSTYRIDEDLHDFIIFMTGSMLRPTVSEIYALQHKHITKMKTPNKTPYLEFSVNRKNKRMLVQTLPTAFHIYEKLVKRRNQRRLNQEEYLFLPQYENRRHAMSIMSRMFNELLLELGMKFGKNGETRTLYSLRHTAIIFNIRGSNLDNFEIAKRADTSIKMIEDYYYPESQTDEQLSSFLREEL